MSIQPSLNTAPGDEPEVVTPPLLVTIGDFVWNDVNANGIQNAGEAGINGVTLTLSGTDGTGQSVTDHATTSGNGAYLFTEAPGTYTVTVDASNFTAGGALAAFTASPTLQGGNTALDSNPNPSGTTFPGALPGGRSDLHPGLRLRQAGDDRRLRLERQQRQRHPGQRRGGHRRRDVDAHRHQRPGPVGHRPRDDRDRRRLPLHRGAGHLHGDGLMPGQLRPRRRALAAFTASPTLQGGNTASTATSLPAVPPRAPSPVAPPT